MSTLTEPAGPENSKRRPFSELLPDVQLAIAETQRADWHKRNPSQISPPAEAWRKVMALANPTMVFDFDTERVFIDPNGAQVTELMLDMYLRGRETGTDLPE